MNLPEKIKNIWSVLESAGHPTFLVGGAVRDYFLGHEPHDFDLATKARPEEIISLAKKHFPDSDINFVGATFGVVLIDGIEIATFRGDRYTGNGNEKDVSISFVDTIEEDLSRRDFTWNAMAISSIGEVIDPFNGYEDLENGIIRFVGDPNVRIAEDANRIIRLCRFVAKNDFEINFETFMAVRDNLHLVSSIAPERIKMEIMKAMELKNASAFWGALLTVGVLEMILPEMAEAWNHTGGKFHTETVWDHMMLAGDHVSTKFPIVKLAAYLHDIGKPLAYKIASDGSFSGHEVLGKNIIVSRLKDLRFSNDEIFQIAGLCKFHMRQMFDLSPKARRKLKKDLNEANLSWEDLTRIRIADTKANIANDALALYEIKNIVCGCTMVEEVVFSTHSLAVSGKDLIREWELSPGPIVGKLQKFLLSFSIEEGNNDPDCLLLKSKDFFS